MDRAAAATMMKKPTARTVSSLATCDEMTSNLCEMNSRDQKLSYSTTSGPEKMDPRTHVELRADSSGGQTGSEDDTSSLGEQVGLGHRVDDACGLLIRGGLCGCRIVCVTGIKARWAVGRRLD
jgi:hypothetical protein